MTNGPKLTCSEKEDALWEGNLDVLLAYTKGGDVPQDQATAAISILNILTKRESARVHRDALTLMADRASGSRPKQIAGTEGRNKKDAP